MALAYSLSSILGALTALIPLALVITALPVLLSLDASTMLVWLSFFWLDSSQTELEIVDMRRRAALFRREKKEGTHPKKVYMFTEAVSRWQWHMYKWSLRIDWVVTLIYRFAIWRKRTLSSAPSEDACAEKIAAMCLETTMAIYCVEVTNDGRTARFEYRDWECGLSHAKSLDDAVRVECFVVMVDLNTKRAVECCLNGEKLTSWTEAADIVFWCWATLTHPLCHCYAIMACSPRSDDPLFARMALYTFAMNYESTNCGYLCVGKDYIETRLQHNMRNGVVPHDGRVLSQLASHSMFVDYCMKARSKVDTVIRQHELPLCSIGYFQVSVVHSLDHWGCMNCGGRRVVGYSDKYGVVAGLHDFFSDFILRVTTDTRLFKVREPWTEDLYRHLCDINPDMASKIHYAISF